MTGETEGRERSERTFLHVDMDAFFVSVEERDNPALRGRPAAVGGGPGKRGVVTSPNYRAREFGVKAGMPLGQALRLCPRLITLPVRAGKYLFVSAGIMSALEEFSPEVRVLSVDEASLDVTGLGGRFGGYEGLGRAVKTMIRGRFGLPCTVGIGVNPLVAKVAAGLAKPDGLMVVESGSERALLAPLPVDKLPGIGPSTATALHRLGITRLGQLANAPERLLKSAFGVMGPVLAEMARGEWSGRMRQDEERGFGAKSIGHQRTFAENLSDPEALRTELVGLAEAVARRARADGYAGRTLTLTIRYADFQTHSHQTVLPEATADEEILIAYAWRLLAEALKSGRAVRLLGLSLGRVSAGLWPVRQGDLFGAGAKRERLYGAMDRLRDRYGERVIGRAMGGRWKPRRGAGIVPFGGSRPGFARVEGGG